MILQLDKIMKLLKITFYAIVVSINMSYFA